MYSLICVYGNVKDEKESVFCQYGIRSRVVSANKYNICRNQVKLSIPAREAVTMQTFVHHTC